MAQDSQKALPLDEVMLAMDVVDTLRHRELLVSRELSSDEREKTLINRLRELYASQGIQVPDHILAEGVEGLKEDRFSYTPPNKSLQLSLARIYVGRRKWLRRASVLLAGLLLLWGAYYLIVERPAKARIDEQVNAIVSEIDSNTRMLDTLDDDRVALQKSLTDTPVGHEGRYATSAMRLQKTASQALEESHEQLDKAQKLEFPKPLNRDTIAEQPSAARERVLEQQDHMNRAQIKLQEGEEAIMQLNALTELPALLDAETAAIEQIAREAAAREKSAEQYDAAISALRAGDVVSAQTAYASLRDLRATLALNYTLRIVSRPEEYSGVWRIPDDNSDAKNYYLIVEAMAADGRTLTVPITNEEDGKVYPVSKWGVRVDESLFQQVVLDKRDDGIIQSREIGRKQNGYLQPVYTVKTNGASITSW